MQPPTARGDDQVPVDYGTIQVDDTFEQINFALAFDAPPIVVATPLTNDDADPATIHVRNVTASGFEIRIQEFDVQADDHAAETVSFLAVAPGHYALDGGELEAGATTGSSTASTTAFVTAFASTPVVFTTVVREAAPADPSAVVTRNSNVSTTQFDLILQEQQVGGSAHPQETVHYLAWTPGVGALNGLAYEAIRSDDNQTHVPRTYNFTTPFPGVPTLIADMQTLDGGDPANLRITTLDTGSVDLFVAEELSDAEQNHTTERVGVLAIEEPTLFLHDGSSINTLPALEQVGGDVRIRFRVMTATGGSVDIDVNSLEYLDPGTGAFRAIAAGDVSGPVTGLASAVDFNGPVHEITWDTTNDANLRDRSLVGVRVRFQVIEGATRSPRAISPSGFTLDTRLPTLNTMPQTAIEDVAFLSTPIALGDLSQVTFGVVQLPSWLTFDVRTGQFSGTPGNADVGTDTVRINVAVGSAPVEANISVTVVNTPPSITSSAPADSLMPGDRFSYDVQSDDEGSGATRYSVTGPEFLSIDPVNGLLSGTVPDDGVAESSVEVFVDDGHGGVASQRFTMNVLSGPLSVDAGDGATIAPGQPARLAATVSGGRPPYRVFWSNGDEGDSTIVEPAETTTYGAIVFDADGRSADDDVTIVVVDPLAVTVAGHPVVVEGETTVLAAVVTGGVPPYDILWSNGRTGVSIEAAPVGASTMSVTVLDAMGTGAVALVDLDSVAPLNVDIDPADAQTADGSVVLRAVIDGGLSPYDVFWSNGDAGVETRVDPGAGGDVVVVVVDALGQSESKTVGLDNLLADTAPGAPVPAVGAPPICGLFGMLGLPLWLLGLAGAGLVRPR